MIPVSLMAQSRRFFFVLLRGVVNPRIVYGKESLPIVYSKEMTHRESILSIFELESENRVQIALKFRGRILYRDGF